MARTLNPFKPGAGRRPVQLAGRAWEINAMDELLEQVRLGETGQGMIFSGLRGIGKTVLLNMLADMAEERDMAVLCMEATPDAATGFAALFDGLTSLMATVRNDGIRERVANAIQRVSAVSLELAPVKIGLNLGDGQSVQSQAGDIFRLQTMVETIAKELQEVNSGLFFFIDELQEMDEGLLGALITLQHTMGQRALPFYIIGAGLPDLPGVLSRSRSYAERLFLYRRLDNLSMDETLQGFCEPVESRGATLTAGAAARLVELSDGYPYFIQAYGAATWNNAESSPIDVPSVEHGIAEAQTVLDEGLYKARWQRASERGREYLAAMASLGGDECAIGDVAATMKASAKQLSMVRSSLIELGLIYSPARGKIAFTVPGMGDFIRREDPALLQPYDGDAGR